MVGIRSASSTGSLNPLSQLFYHCSPETEMGSLVTHPDWSEARKSATLAMSSGLPIRLIV
jgi:hypothetical protein